MRSMLPVVLLTLAGSLTACDPGLTVVVDNQSAADLFLRVTDGQAVYVFEVPAGSSGYGPNGLGDYARGVEVLDRECHRLWANDISRGTFVLRVSGDQAVTAAEQSVADSEVPLIETGACGSNMYDPDAPHSPDSSAGD